MKLELVQDKSAEEVEQVGYDEDRESWDRKTPWP